MAELALEDGHLWYELQGTGRPLVFIHGGWSNARAWAPQVDRFADEYQILTLDVRGHGNTGATDSERYSIERFTDDLERLLNDLDLEQPVLCGLSLGSMVVQEFLNRHPNDVAGAILAGAVRSMPPLEVPNSTKALFSPTPAIAASVALSGSTATFRSMCGSIRAATGGDWLSVNPEIRRDAIAAVDDIDEAEFRKIFDALYRYNPPDLSVDTPTLVVHGGSEAPLVKRQGRRLVAGLPRGERVEIPDSGHLVNQDRPAAFNTTCATFLESAFERRKPASSE
ncbi:alpha/beta fold hydrolase [Natronorubrum daqingense]|nr:alpha/beta hydrolase [Natronorubrum daqingense]APX98121.1 alpha/beta hydrolase [Natronorubrum daqingense]